MPDLGIEVTEMINSKYANVILGLSIIGTLICSNAVLARDSVDETKAATADGFVKINIIRGEINVEGWDRNEVRVVGSLDDKVKQFIFEVNGNDTVIAVKLPKNNRSWSGSRGSRLRIKVPVGSSVKIGVVSTEVQVENISGGLELRGVSGDMRVENVKNRIHISSVSGEVELRDSTGRTRVTSVSGEIEAYDVHGTSLFHSVSGNILLVRVSDKLDLETVSGDIEVVDSVLSSASGHSVSGDIDLESELIGAGDIEFDTVSGSVRLRLGGELNSSFDLQTQSGSIRNRLTDDRPTHSKYVRDEKLRFRMGDGDGDIIINTHSGDIILSAN